MNYAKVELEMAPCTQRVIRGLNGTDMQQDPEVRYWKRVSAIVCAGCMATFIALIAIAGVYAPYTASSPAAPAESAAGPIDADVLWRRSKP